MHPELFASLVETTYDAVLDPSRWPRAMQLVTDALAGSCSSVLVSDTVTGALSFVAQDPRLPPEVAADYLAHFIDADTVRASGARGPVGVPHTERDFLGPDTVDVYNDFYVRWDWGHVLGMYIFRDGPSAGTLSVYRSNHGAPFAERELDLAVRIAGHLARAVQIQSRLASVERQKEMILDALDVLAPGILFLDAGGRIILMNRAARDMTSRRDGLTVERGELLGTSPASTRSVRGAIACALTRPLDPPWNVTVQRPSGKRPFLIHASPVRNRMFEGRAACVMVVITDTDREVVCSAETLRSTYSLSPAEAAVAIALCNGSTVKEIALARQVTINTVHTQLESLQRKVGANRQAGIVSVLLRGPLGVMRSAIRDDDPSEARVSPQGRA